MWAGMCIAVAVAGNAVWIDHVDTVNLDGSAIDQNGDSFSVTGLSGIVWAGGNTFKAVMDNSNHVIVLDVEDGGGALNVETVGGLSFESWRPLVATAAHVALRAKRRGTREKRV